MLDLNAAMGECWVASLEYRKPVIEAPLDSEPIDEYFTKRVFLDPVPPVPDPVDDRFVRTGRLVPCSAMWDPVDRPTRSLIGLFRDPPPRGPLPRLGCMNYLHGHRSAPQLLQVSPEWNYGVDVTWRLMWRDNRYRDGTLPEEEAAYVFDEPKPRAPTVPAPPPQTVSSLVALESGRTAPGAGRWRCRTCSASRSTSRRARRCRCTRVARCAGCRPIARPTSPAEKV